MLQLRPDFVYIEDNESSILRRITNFFIPLLILPFTITIYARATISFHFGKKFQYLTFFAAKCFCAVKDKRILPTFETTRLQNFQDTASSRTKKKYNKISLLFQSFGSKKYGLFILFGMFDFLANRLQKKVLFSSVCCCFVLAFSLDSKKDRCL